MASRPRAKIKRRGVDKLEIGDRWQSTRAPDRFDQGFSRRDSSSNNQLGNRPARQPPDFRLAYRCRVARTDTSSMRGRAYRSQTAMVALTMAAPSSSPAAVPGASIGANRAHGPVSRLIELATRRPADFMAFASPTASVHL